MNFGAALKAARQKTGLLQAEFANRVDLDTSYVSMLENNRKSPTLTVYFRICEVLNLSPSQMMKLVEDATDDLPPPKGKRRGGGRRGS